MNYANHNLKTKIQEWIDRLYQAPSSQFASQLKFLLNNFKTNNQIAGILNEIIHLHKFESEALTKALQQSYGSIEMEYQNEKHQAAFCYQYLLYCIDKGSYNLQHYPQFQNGDGTIKGIIDDYITPITHFIQDRLDKSNATIYLLEKYKRRTEWFTWKEIYQKYSSADKSYEQILEDDLRMFLFDQGIEFPFSTPLSASGRADIIGNLETEDPLIIEIKIFDRKKGYGKDRIKGGLSQAVKYANDYNKDVGYLVIFNMEEVELNFKFTNDDDTFPPRLTFNNKTFYFLVINSFIQNSASKLGTIKEIEITEAELTKK